MSYELIWIEHGDLAGHYTGRVEAEADLRSHARAHPEHPSELTLIEVDDDTGRRIGEYLTGAELIARTGRLTGRMVAARRAPDRPSFDDDGVNGLPPMRTDPRSQEVTSSRMKRTTPNSAEISEKACAMNGPWWAGTMWLRQYTAA